MKTKQNYIRIQLFPYNSSRGSLGNDEPDSAQKGFYFKPVELNVKFGTIIKLGRRVDKVRQKSSTEDPYKRSSSVNMGLSGRANNHLSAATDIRASNLNKNSLIYKGSKGSNAIITKETFEYSANDLIFAGIIRDINAGKPAVGPLGKAAKEVLSSKAYTNGEDENGESQYKVSVPVISIAFRSKVVSRSHAEIWVDLSSKVYFRDTGSSSGTFMNRMRLSPSGEKSRSHILNSGDILQLGMDYQNNQMEMFKSVLIKFITSTNVPVKSVEDSERLNLVIRDLNISMNPSLNGTDIADADVSTDCCICLGGIALMQALFIASCSHVFHYHCVVPLLRSGVMFLCPLCRQTTNLDSKCSESSGLTDMYSEDESLENRPEDSANQTEKPEIPEASSEVKDLGKSIEEPPNQIALVNGSPLNNPQELSEDPKKDETTTSEHVARNEDSDKERDNTSNINKLNEDFKCAPLAQCQCTKRENPSNSYNLPLRNDLREWTRHPMRELYHLHTCRHQQDDGRVVGFDPCHVHFCQADHPLLHDQDSCPRACQFSHAGIPTPKIHCCNYPCCSNPEFTPKTRGYREIRSDCAISVKEKKSDCNNRDPDGQGVEFEDGNHFKTVINAKNNLCDYAFSGCTAKPCTYPRHLDVTTNCRGRYPHFVQELDLCNSLDLNERCGQPSEGLDRDMKDMYDSLCCIENPNEFELRETLYSSRHPSPCTREQYTLRSTLAANCQNRQHPSLTETDISQWTYGTRIVGPHSINILKGYWDRAQVTKK